MKIGLFGGTFDPLHNEHINICITAKTEFMLDKVFVIPSGNPPHKKSGLFASKEDRFNMTKIAFENSEIIVSDYEMQKKEPSYTINTLKYFKKKFPNDDIYLIIGADSLIDIKKWNKPVEILSLCKIIVCKRKGYDKAEIFADILKKDYNADILFCDYVGSYLSSTALKVYLEFGVDCYNDINKNVLKYIKDNNLYSNYSFYIEKLKTMLSEKRFNHTVSTVICALKLAKKLDFDQDKTFLAAALHDCTKKLSDEKLKNLGFVLNSTVPEPVAHSVSGSFIARTVFNIKDKDILNSIRYHTTGRPKMSKLEKIIYVADCIEKTRDYDGVEYLREEVKKDFEKGFIECLKLTMEQLLEKDRQEVSDLTNKAYEYYITKNK